MDPVTAFLQFINGMGGIILGGSVLIGGIFAFRVRLLGKDRTYVQDDRGGFTEIVENPPEIDEF